MVALLWETALLLLGAYFVGAFCGCMIRRLLFPSTLRVADAAIPATIIETTTTETVVASSSDRFARALTGETLIERQRQEEQERVARETAERRAPIAPQIETITPSVADEPLPPREQVGPVAARLAEAWSKDPGVRDVGRGLPTTTAIPAAPEPPAAVQPPFGDAGTAVTASAAAAAITAAAADLAAAAATRKSPGRDNDLEDIRGIDARIAAALRDRGVTRWADIAGWTRSDVARYEAELGVGDAISAGNWIEQASILAAGGTTAHAARRAMGRPLTASPSADRGEPRVIVHTASTASTAAPPTPRPAPAVVIAPPSIPAAAAPTATALASVTAAAATAAAEALAASAAQSRMRTGSDSDMRLPLASNTSGSTSVAAQIEPLSLKRDEPRAIPPGDRQSAAGERFSWDASAVGAATTGDESGAGRSAAAAIAAAAAAAAVTSSDRGDGSAHRPTVIGERDDLTRIDGINAEVQEMLYRHGVRRVTHIADWNRDDGARFDRLLGSSDRVAREDWVGQARALLGRSDTGTAPAPANASAPGWTEAAPTDAGVAVALAAASAAAALAGSRRANDQPHGDAPEPAPTTAPMPAAEPAAEPAAMIQDAAPERGHRDYAGLRSVRSAALVGDSPAPLQNDDLKRIRGVGVRDETRLAAIGITSYEQIANWSAEDLAEVSQALEVRGRIERENWIEQARILAWGRQTAFAERLDRERAPTTAALPANETTVSSGSTSQPAAPLAAMQTALATAAPDHRPIAAAAHADDLKRIRGVGILIEKKLMALGVTSYEQIANWTAADVARISEGLAFQGRIERENWIEQARILAAGGATEFSARFDRGDAGR